MTSTTPQGILLIDKPLGITSFGVIAVLRRITKVRKIGHCGTLDPLASGLLVCLVGKNYTRLSDKLTAHNKTYLAEVHLGAATTTFDKEGETTQTSDLIPTVEEVQLALETFQGTTLQTPPIFSAKKVGGQKACDLARKGKSIELQPVSVTMNIELIDYHYPHLLIKVASSKGTYIRSLAHDLGKKLSTWGHLSSLRRLQSGSFSLDQAISLSSLKENPNLLDQYLKSDSYV